MSVKNTPDAVFQNVTVFSGSALTHLLVYSDIYMERESSSRTIKCVECGKP